MTGDDRPAVAPAKRPHRRSPWPARIAWSAIGAAQWAVGSLFLGLVLGVPPLGVAVGLALAGGVLAAAMLTGDWYFDRRSRERDRAALERLHAALEVTSGEATLAEVSGFLVEV